MPTGFETEEFTLALMEDFKRTHKLLGPNNSRTASYSTYGILLTDLKTWFLLGRE